MSSRLVTFAALAAALLLTACSKPSSHGFRRVDLTTEDIVSLFNVPLNKSEIGKFEWSLGREHYVRAVVERSDDSGKTWQVAESYPRNLAVLDATLIYKLERLEPQANAPRYLLRVRLGGRRIGVSGWSESSCFIELPESNLTTESLSNDPERILTIASGSRVYRLRLEAQEKPWGKR